MSGRSSSSGLVWALVVGFVVIALAAVAGHVLTSGSSVTSRTSVATVVSPVPCGKGSGDLVRVDIQGRPQTVRLDGCGHLKGQKLTVQSPTAAAGATAKPLAGDSAQPSTEERLAWVLVTLAGISAGGLALHARYRRS